jgi:hypothetical protein
MVGVQSNGTLHLSGAQISTPDRGKIAEDVLAYLKAQRVPVEMVDGLICGVAEVASAVATHSLLEASAAT